ncbi:MAG: magnesium/cobalt transporter CorA [Acidobacteriia bacterium]|nr:magnesium/cobalt transporter CorA [Terriglobia bacterium]
MSRKHRRHRISAPAFPRRSLPGSAPGTLIVDPQAPKPVIQVMAYSPEKVLEQDIDDVHSIRSFLREWPVTWVSVMGLGDVSVITKVGEIFNLHRLALEDVLNVHQRAKVDQFKDNCFIVVRAINAEEAYSSEQLSIFLGKNYLLTFQERTGSYFDPVRERIRKDTGRLRLAGPDHLAYALIDATIDWYFPVLEKYGETLEVIEDAVVAQPEKRFIRQIHEMRYALLTLRRTVWPLREAVNALCRDPLPLISDETRIYLRDCYDHTVQIIDLLENYRDVASSLMEVYLSSLGNRTNEIMKVLTMFAAIFIPLSFIAGIYGMNFDIPELKWALGYPYALGLMALVAIGLLYYFRRKGWLGSEKEPTQNSEPPTSQTTKSPKQ